MTVKLIRNSSPDKVCKYALIRLDKMRIDNTYDRFMRSLEAARFFLQVDIDPKYIEPQKIGDNEESFVIKLKDVCAPATLQAYADEWERVTGDKGFADEVRQLAERAKNHPNQKVAD